MHWRAGIAAMALSHQAIIIWNRAATDNGGAEPARGDRMLAALLYSHGLVMNGGVVHAVEIMQDTELANAMAGYRFFSLASVADLLARAKMLFQSNSDFGRHEASFDAEYARYIPSDSRLCELFERYFADNPLDFAPP
jgi:hypothetical protein